MQPGPDSSTLPISVNNSQLMKGRDRKGWGSHTGQKSAEAFNNGECNLIKEHSAESCWYAIHLAVGGYICSRKGTSENSFESYSDNHIIRIHREASKFFQKAISHSSENELWGGI